MKFSLTMPIGLIGILLMSACAQTPSGVAGADTPIKRSSNAHVGNLIPGYRETGAGRKEAKYIVGLTFNMETAFKVERTDNIDVKTCQFSAGQRFPYKKMLKACDRALQNSEIMPVNRNITHYNRGLVHLNLRQFGLARQDFQQSLALDPELVENILALATLEYMDNNLDQSLKHAQTALASNSSNPAYAYYVKGNVHEARFQFSEARYAYEAALKIRPNWRTVQQQLAFINRNWPEGAG